MDRQVGHIAASFHFRPFQISINSTPKLAYPHYLHIKCADGEVCEFWGFTVLWSNVQYLEDKICQKDLYFICQTEKTEIVPSMYLVKRRWTISPFEGTLKCQIFLRLLKGRRCKCRGLTISPGPAVASCHLYLFGNTAFAGVDHRFVTMNALSTT